MSLLAPTLITAPAWVPYRFGLASILSFPAEADHWRMGVEWQSPACGQAAQVTTDECITGVAATPKTPFLCPGVQQAAPFTVYAYDDLPTVGTTAEEQRAWARAVLDAGEWPAVEQYVAAALEAEIGATPASDLGAGASPADALGMIEDALALAYGGQGAVLTSRRGATILFAAGALRLEGSRLVTALGTPVAALAHPVAAPGSFPIYGTGALFGWRSDVDVIEAVNTATNRWSLVAERTYLVGWDCGAVKVQSPVPSEGTATP
jgi:hypothetical protein